MLGYGYEGSSGVLSFAAFGLLNTSQSSNRKQNVGRR